MTDRSNKPPKRNSLKAKKNNRQKSIREIEYYLNHDGNDTQIIKDIAVSSLIPKVEGGKKNILASHYKLMGVPFFMGLEDDFTGKFVSSPFWSFTMMVKKGGDHKLLFSSQEDAEELYTLLLKED